MKKNQLLTVLGFMVISTLAQAKVQGFNAMINENLAQQATLHSEINSQLDSKDGKPVVVQDQKVVKSSVEVNSELTAYNPRTPKKLLTYNKERSSYKASSKKQQDRLAHELKELDSEF